MPLCEKQGVSEGTQLPYTGNVGKCIANFKLDCTATVGHQVCTEQANESGGGMPAGGTGVIVCNTNTNYLVCTGNSEHNSH